MASLRPRDTLKTKWQIRYRDRNRNPQYATDSLWKREHAPEGAEGYTQAQAETEKEWREQLYRRGEYDPWVQDAPDQAVRTEVTTVGEAIDLYINDKTEAGERGERRGWSKNTANRYKPTLKHFARAVGRSRLLSHLSPTDIRSFVYRDDLSDASKRTYYGMIRTWTRWLKKKGLAEVEMPPEIQTTRKLPDWCSREQLARVIRAFRHVCKGDVEANSDPEVTLNDSRLWMADAWQFAFWQALRRGEIVSIRCGAVDLGERRMVVGDEHFVPKGKREDVIPLSEPAAQIAKEWGAHERPPKERLFKHKRGEKVSKAFTEARKEAIHNDELPEDARLDETAAGVTLHSLRHGRAIDLIKKRRHVVYVSQFLRHSSLDITRRYLQVVPRHLQKEIRELEEEALEI